LALKAKGLLFVTVGGYEVLLLVLLVFKNGLLLAGVEVEVAV